MTSRQRGAAYVLGLLVLGRVLDGLDLPFEAQPQGATGRAAADASTRPDSSSAPSVPAARDTSGERAPRPRGAAVPDRVVRVNVAGTAELVALPGVGPVMAQRILEYRVAHG